MTSMSCTSFARRRRILRKNANRKGAITLKHHEAEQHECAKCSLEQPLEGSRSASNQRLIPIGLSLSLLVVGMLMPPLPLWSVLVLSISYIIVGWPIIRHAGRNILRGQVFDEYGLMTIATFGAIALGEFPEAVAVMVFFSIGEYFQERAVDNSRRSIKALLSLRPDYANLKNGEVVTAVAPESVSVGQVIVVRPGERVPLDGIVREGESLLDTSPLTGESIPRVVTVGHEILAGTINQAGLLEVEVTKIYANSTVAKILELVEQASERKASTERFITSFARYYTPAVVVGAALLALLPPLLIPGQTFAVWVYRALVMLVISCPCALVVSVPLSYFGGIGAASRQGILSRL
ncbi:MAG: HAD-IC family P-type ATPase [Firmicutes bacterium]|nr:HAD-IC family P-type ATPase [Dethiobacter sp.]MBS3888120.1 HAD-IC family P-type ATPase [Bacillota bacterium]